MRMVRVGALVIGSGCAGYAAADALFACGVTDCAVLTKGRLDGTSRNTGSDKQTYYKLSLCSDREDSVTGMLHISARLSVDSSVMTNSMKRQAASFSLQVSDMAKPGL